MKGEWIGVHKIDSKAMTYALQQMNRSFLRQVCQGKVEKEVALFYREVRKEFDYKNQWLLALYVVDEVSLEILSRFETEEEFKSAVEAALEGVLDGENGTSDSEWSDTKWVVAYYQVLYHTVRWKRVFADFLDAVMGKRFLDRNLYQSVQEMKKEYMDNHANIIASCFRKQLQESGVEAHFAGVKAFEQAIGETFKGVEASWCDAEETVEEVADNLRGICVGRYAEVYREEPLDIPLKMKRANLERWKEFMRATEPVAPDIAEQFKAFQHTKDNSEMGGDVFLGYAVSMILVGDEKIGYFPQVKVDHDFIEEPKRIVDGETILFDFTAEEFRAGELEWDVFAKQWMRPPNIRVTFQVEEPEPVG